MKTGHGARKTRARRRKKTSPDRRNRQKRKGIVERETDRVAGEYSGGTGDCGGLIQFNYVMNCRVLSKQPSSPRLALARARGGMRTRAQGKGAKERERERGAD